MATGTIRPGESRTPFTRVSRAAAIEARRIEATTGKPISQLISEGKAKIVKGEIVYIKPTPKDYSIPSPGTQKFREMSKEYEASLAIQKTTAPIKTKLSWLEQKKLEAKREQELKELIQLEELKRRQEAPLPQWVTDFVGDPLKLSKRDRKIILPFYGKTSAEALKQKEATTSYLNYISREIKTNPEKIAIFAALPPALKIAGRGIQAAGITKLITKVPSGQLIARRTVQLVSTGIGVVYSKNVYDRVTESVFTDYKDGKTTTTEKTLPNGDIEITTTTEQIPQFRKPTGPEQIERLSGIYATELAPMQISHKIINRGVKAGYTKPAKLKTKVKITTKIKHAGRIIKTTPTKIKTLPKKIKKIIEVKKIRQDNKKREIALKKIEKAKLKEKVTVLEVIKGKLKLHEITHKKLIEKEVKAKGIAKKNLQKRLRKVEKNIKKAKEKIAKEKVTVLEITKKGAKLKVTTRAKLEKAELRKKVKAVKRIKKITAKEKRVLWRKQLVKKMYNNIKKLVILKTKLKALISKIIRISTSTARRLGFDKAKEIRRLNMLIHETDLVKSYFIIIQKGGTRKAIMLKLDKLPDTKLNNIDTQTNKLVTDIKTTIKNTDLKIIKPSKRPPEIKEVREDKAVLIQKLKQKEIKVIDVSTLIKTKNDIKTLNILTTNLKSIGKTKPKTSSAIKIKQKQLQKTQAKIKSKQKKLLFYNQDLLTTNNKMKHQIKTLTSLISIQTPKQQLHTKQTLKSMSKQISVLETLISSITKTIAKSKAVVVMVQSQILKLPPIIPPILTLPKKVDAKKKKKIKGKKPRYFIVKNPIPTFKDIYG